MPSYGHTVKMQLDFGHNDEEAFLFFTNPTLLESWGQPWYRFPGAQTVKSSA